MNIASLKHLAYILKCKTSEQEIISICSQLYVPGYSLDIDFYREKIEQSTTAKGRIKKRIINPSKGRLKLIQEKIKDNILDKIPLPWYVQGAQKGFSNISNASLHLGNKFKFTTDLKRFFPSITPIQVYSSFCEQGFNPDVSRALTLLCTYKGRVPQGASTSASVANIVFLKSDKEINALCSEAGLLYTRYIDDITISSKSDFKSVIPQVIRIISDAGFTISIPKTFYRHIIDITGITVGNNSMKPNGKFFDRLNSEKSEESKKARLEYLKRVVESKKMKFPNTK